MIRKIIRGIIFSFLLIGTSAAQTLPPKPFGPVPDENQLKWQEMEYYAFLHFSLNTFTDQEWGNGDEDVSLFNPKELDCRQWARVCKEAGMKGIIMVVKAPLWFLPLALKIYGVFCKKLSLERW